MTYRNPTSSLERVIYGGLRRLGTSTDEQLKPSQPPVQGEGRFVKGTHRQASWLVHSEGEVD